MKKSFTKFTESISKQQHETGYFYTVLVTSQTFVERIMTTALTTKVLCHILLKYGYDESVATIIEKSIYYLTEAANKNKPWQWNYYPSHLKPTYPDDYDDTAASLEAILLWELVQLTFIQDFTNFRSQSGTLVESLRNHWRSSLISHFPRLNEDENYKQNHYINPIINGYKTWITGVETRRHNASWLENIDPVVNVHIASVCLLLGLHNYIPKTYIKNCFANFKESSFKVNNNEINLTGYSSEFYVSSIPYLHALTFLGAHKIEGKYLLGKTEIMLIEKALLEQLNAAQSAYLPLYIEFGKRVKDKQNVEYATCPAYHGALTFLYFS